MNYHKQTRDACLAYSLLQLGRVSKKAVKDYETTLEMVNYRPTYANVSGWLSRNAPEVEQAWHRLLNTRVPMNGIEIPDGAGILVILSQTGSMHAISYEDGQVLDPAEDSPGITETFDRLVQRYKKDGLDIIPIGAFPINK